MSDASPRGRYAVLLGIVLLVAAAAGLWSAYSGGHAAPACFGTWRFEVATAVEDARKEYGEAKSQRWRRGALLRLDATARSDLVGFDVSIGPSFTARFQYIGTGEPAVDGSWEEEGGGRLVLHFEAGEGIEAPKELRLRWAANKVWMMMPEAIEVPLRRVGGHTSDAPVK